MSSRSRGCGEIYVTPLPGRDFDPETEYRVASVGCTATKLLPKNHVGRWDFTSIECMFDDKSLGPLGKHDPERVRQWLTEHKDDPLVHVCVDLRCQNAGGYYLKAFYSFVRCVGCGVGEMSGEKMPDFMREKNPILWQYAEMKF